MSFCPRGGALSPGGGGVLSPGGVYLVLGGCGLGGVLSPEGVWSGGGGVTPQTIFFDF